MKINGEYVKLNVDLYNQKISSITWDARMDVVEIVKNSAYFNEALEKYIDNYYTDTVEQGLIDLHKSFNRKLEQDVKIMELRRGNW